MPNGIISVLIIPTMSIKSLSDTQINKYIEDNLAIREKERDNYAEVFTSPKLINELLDNLPTNSWTNPDLTWLDPCAGKGFFGVLIYQRLISGLSKKIPDLKKRKEHILDNMLFMIEINKDNGKSLYKLFGGSTKISVSDFIEEPDKWERDLGRKQFDIVIGNPPFQTPKEETYTGSAGNRTLWNQFVEGIFEKSIIAIKGHLAFITPSGWRRPEHPIFDKLTKDNRLLYLHIYSKSDGQQLLGAQTRFDLYVVQEGIHLRQKTRIIDEKGKTHTINVNKWPFIPNYAFSKIKNILVSKDKGIKIIFSAGDFGGRVKLTKNKTKKHRHPIVHTITQKGLGIRYSKKTHAHKPKVLLNFNERQYPYNDYKGEYGMSQLTFGIPIKSKKEGDDWIRTINSEVFQEIIKATKWNTFQTDYRMFKWFDPKLYTNRLVV